MPTSSRYACAVSCPLGHDDPQHTAEFGVQWARQLSSRRALITNSRKRIRMPAWDIFFHFYQPDLHDLGLGESPGVEANAKRLPVVAGLSILYHVKSGRREMRGYAKIVRCRAVTRNAIQTRERGGPLMILLCGDSSIGLCTYFMYNECFLAKTISSVHRRDDQRRFGSYDNEACLPYTINSFQGNRVRHSTAIRVHGSERTK